MRQSSEPIFNVPPIVVATLAVLVLVHLIRVYVLSEATDDQLLRLLSFVPARYGSQPLPDGVLLGGFGAEIWTFFTYALIHGDFVHLTVNGVWFLAFGSATARRFGSVRFLAFFAVTAAAGAALFLVAHPGDFVSVIGASAAISGCMAAATRFAFDPHGPLSFFGRHDDAAYRRRAAPLLVALRQPRVFIFLLVWFGLNALFGLGSLSLGGNDQPVAWEAHVGGFLAGLLLFPLFDPVPNSIRDDAELAG